MRSCIPSRRVFLEGVYERTDAVIDQSLPAPFAVDIEERIVRAVRDQLTPLASGHPFAKRHRFAGDVYENRLELERAGGIAPGARPGERRRFRIILGIRDSDRRSQ